MARSTFGRLFTYARDTKTEALENFTTEALAAAIRENPEPLVHLFRGMLLLPSEGEPVEVVPSTQVGIPGAGILDLVVDFRYVNAAIEIWIEVKVFAGESGSQLNNYLSHLSMFQDPEQPTLATLAKRPLRDSAAIPWIPWQAIWRIAHRSPPSSTHWRDLRRFLEEIRMADRFDDPISAREVTSLGDASGLFGKTRRLLAAFALESNARWPAFPWPTEERQIQRVLARQFASHGRLIVVAGEAHRAYLIVGVTPIDGEAHAGIWVETRDKAVEPRRRVIAAADAGGLDAAWERDIGSWGGLHRFERLVGFRSHAAVIDWFIERLQELDAAGILALIPALGEAQPGESSEDDLESAL